MGLNNADIVKVEDDSQVWKGDKNLQTYENEFEKQLLARVRIHIFRLNCEYRVRMSTHKSQLVG